MIFNDTRLIQEAYENVQQTILEEKKKKPKPHYLDADGKAVASKGKKIKMNTEGLSFKDRFNSIINEESPYSNAYETDKKIWSLKRQIHPEAQYFIHYKSGTKSKPLKGESVLMTLKADIHDIESIEPVHKQ